MAPRCTAARGRAFRARIPPASGIGRYLGPVVLRDRLRAGGSRLYGTEFRRSPGAAGRQCDAELHLGGILARRRNHAGQQPKIALLPWGNVVERFLDPIGLSLEDFCERMTGGWLFGYIEALRSAGWQSVLFLVSRSVETPTRREHAPSGTPLCVLPASKPYRIVASGMTSPDGGPIRRVVRFARRELTPYMATPFVALARNLKREGCTAILTQEYEYARFDLCVMLGRLLRLPVYATFQGGDRHSGRLEDLLRPIALRAAQGLIVGAELEARRVIERYGVAAEKIWRIHNPIDLDLWRPIDRETARQAAGLPPDIPIVVYHGRIDMHRKGLDLLLDAWEQLRGDPASNGAHLLIIGSGHDDAALRERLQRAELSNVQWIARYELDRTVMRLYLSAADFYVLPSRSDGFPVAPLEAMACGLPIVGSDIPAMLNILERGADSGGIIVRRDDPRALAEALRQLLAHPELFQELGRKARRNAEERFSISAVGRQLGQMLDQSRERALGQHSTGPFTIR
jgi:glycosyltransferase involved in cell wall biosynthesis